MKKLIISPFFVLILITSYSQFKNAPKINTGIACRPELFELTNYIVRGGPEKGYQFKGISFMNKPNLVLELSQKLNHERWIVKLSNYFSRNYLVTTVDSFNKPVKDLYSFKYDLFFDINYELRLRKHKYSFFYLGAGIGRMNISKKFDYNFPTGERDINGNRIFEKRATSLAFWAPRLSVGFAYKNFNVFVIAHGTPDEDLNSNPSLWVEYKLLYSFQLKKRKSK
jgi:hypothetical protein